MSHIFVVEDDENIREMLLYALETSGFSVLGFENGDDVMASLKKMQPSLILLDIMLPGIDGITLLAKIKKINSLKDIPIIMLTAKGREIDRIKGLDLGADDYVTKPFSVMEVVARVRAVLRRYKKDADFIEEIKIGNILLNPAKRIVYLNKKELTLTYKEFELLQYLMINEGFVLSREKILEEVWGFDYTGESRTVDMHIKTLRQKLGEESYIIKTVRNVGYKIGGNN